MSGIVFFKTRNRDKVSQWYQENIDADVWLEQTGCTILNSGEFRFGFCDGEETETDGILTFVYDDEEAVDEMHERLGDAVRENPHENEQYQIYQFFAEDPDGRTVEVQTFLHDTPAVGNYA
ncbi:VOC family protein (plasmid) [Haloferax larsenii]|uniref:VOC family protein n=1 Tax=Haloferax larsenii TaxID=302484 RepID=A0ABY5RIK9_HALLR|nr:VOC family protein [Haloferax larsenii]UVE52197.1 VOC family protein [Haloferax larsenii]